MRGIGIPRIGAFVKNRVWFKGWCVSSKMEGSMVLNVNKKFHLPLSIENGSGKK